MEHDITVFTQSSWTKIYELKHDGYIFEEIVPNWNIMPWETQDEIGKDRICAKIKFYRNRKNDIYSATNTYFLRIEDGV